MMNLTHDWFYKDFISVKGFLNSLTYFAILSCCFMPKTKRIMHLISFQVFCGIYCGFTLICGGLILALFAVIKTP